MTISELEKTRISIELAKVAIQNGSVVLTSDSMRSIYFTIGKKDYLFRDIVNYFNKEIEMTFSLD